jgi:hypothetical protein
MFMEDGALQQYRPCPSAAYAAYAFYFSRRNEILNNTVNYEFTLFLYIRWEAICQELKGASRSSIFKS